MSTFNKVVFRHVGVSERNVHIAVHPFPCEDGTRGMSWRTDYGSPLKEALAEWKCRLADALWDGIPGLHDLFFSNGMISIQHTGAFSDKEVLTAAEAIIRPVLAAQLAVSQMWTGDIEPADDDPWGRPDSEWWGLVEPAP